MKIQCTRCNVSYNLDDNKITRDVMKVKCTNCGNLFVVQKQKQRAEIEPVYRRAASETIRKQIETRKRESLSASDLKCTNCGNLFVVQKQKQRAEIEPVYRRAASETIRKQIETRKRESLSASTRRPVSAGIFDYVPGLIVMFLLTFGAILFGNFLKSIDPNLIGRYHLNYVLILLVVGMAWRNLIGIPDSLMRGISLGRPLLKIGIIIMGLRLGLGAVASIGFVGLLIITIFVFGSVALMLFLGKKINIEDYISDVLASAVGICGVSAAIAAAPVFT